MRNGVKLIIIRHLIKEFDLVNLLFVKDKEETLNLIKSHLS